MANPNNPDSTDLDRLHAAVKREKADLPAGAEPAPMWALFLGFIVAIIGGGQLGGTSTSSLLESTPNLGVIIDPRPGAGAGDDNLDPFQLAMKKGATSYAVCGGCHQATGAGVPGQFPPLAGSEIVLGGTERLVRIALHGLTGPVTVKGQAFNTPGGMPPQGLSMSDTDIANVLTFVRNSWGNEASMLTKDMVAKVRDAEKGHAQWTMSDLEKHAKVNCPGDVPAGPGAAPVADKK